MSDQALLGAGGGGAPRILGQADSPELPPWPAGPGYVDVVAKIFDSIDDNLRAWIEAQPMWFVATAPSGGDGHVNLSPRGHDTFSVLNAHRVAWVDYTGSGVETIAHLRENGRVCPMFTSFDGRPRIVRLHGRGSVALPGEAAFEDVVSRHPAHPSTRAVITVDVTRISDSCGWGVPVMTMTGERDLLRLQAENKGTTGMVGYRAERNAAASTDCPGSRGSARQGPAALGEAGFTGGEGRAALGPRRRGRVTW